MSRGEGRILHGDCRAVLPTLDAESFDSIVTDPPYGLSREPDMAEVLRHWLAGDDYAHSSRGFMGKSWDNFVPGPSVWREALRVLKPGGFCLSFFGDRTFDMGVTAMRLAGFEIRTMHVWLHGCLDTETMAVSEDRGVVPHTELLPGDRVLVYDVNLGGYSYQPLIEVVEYDYDDTAFRLIGDAGEQVVSRNHRCIVERNGVEEFQFAEALQREARIPFLESLPSLRKALLRDEPKGCTVQKDVQHAVLSETDRSGKCWQADSTEGSKRSSGSVCGLSNANMETGCLAEADSAANVLQAVRGQDARPGMGGARAQGACSLDGEKRGELPIQNVGREEPVMEGRHHVYEGARVLRRSQVREVSSRVPADGSEGWLRDRTSSYSSQVHRSVSDEGRGGTPHQSPASGQSVGKPDAVSDECGTQSIRGWSGHRTDLVRVVPFHLRGKVWCLRVPTGAFVAVRGGVAFPTGNSGMPKVGYLREDDGETHVRAGWGGSLRPMLEPLVMARKPLSEGTLVANVRRWGTGGLNVDGCRVSPGSVVSGGGNGKGNYRYGDSANYTSVRPLVAQHDKGRWPPNVQLSFPDDRYQLKADVSSAQKQNVLDWLHENP